MEPILIWVIMVPTLSSYTMLTQVMRVGLILGSHLCIRTFR